MGRGKLAMRRVAFALVAGLCCLALAEATADVATKVNCKQSDAAVSTVCDLFGLGSDACKVSAKQHEDAGCSLGESASQAPSERNGCFTGNDADREQPNSQEICAAAKRLCGIKTKDYCTTAAHVDCMATIGQICEDANSASPAERQAVVNAAANPDAPPVVDEAATPLNTNTSSITNAVLNPEKDKEIAPAALSSGNSAGANSTAANITASTGADSTAANITASTGASSTVPTQSIDEDIATATSSSSNATENQLATSINSDVDTPPIS